jgi:hypothetical protein
MDVTMAHGRISLECECCRVSSIPALEHVEWDGGKSTAYDGTEAKCAPKSLKEGPWYGVVEEDEIQPHAPKSERRHELEITF